MSAIWSLFIYYIEALINIQCSLDAPMPKHQSQNGKRPFLMKLMMAGAGAAASLTRHWIIRQEANSIFFSNIFTENGENISFETYC